MQYKEYKPHQYIRPYIKCYWTLKRPESLPPSEDRQFFNDGAEFILNLGNNRKTQKNGNISSTIGSAGLLGPTTKPKKIKQTGPIDLFGVCFHPGGGYKFLPLPAHELTNQYTDVDEIWGSDGLRFVEQIRNTCFTIQKMIDEVDKYFLDRIEKNRNDDVAVEAALHAIIAHKGQISVKRLAQKANLSCRHLERKFKERVGVSPKQLCQSSRFKNVFKYLEESPSAVWSTVALACGYYDQAHMIRDFKHYTGSSPGAYFKYKPGMERFIIGNS